MPRALREIMCIRSRNHSQNYLGPPEGSNRNGRRDDPGIPNRRATPYTSTERGIAGLSSLLANVGMSAKMSPTSIKSPGRILSVMPLIGKK